MTVVVVEDQGVPTKQERGYLYSPSVFISANLCQCLHTRFLDVVRSWLPPSSDTSESHSSCRTLLRSAMATSTVGAQMSIPPSAAKKVLWCGVDRDGVGNYFTTGFSRRCPSLAHVAREYQICQGNKGLNLFSCTADCCALSGWPKGVSRSHAPGKTCAPRLAISSRL